MKRKSIITAISAAVAVVALSAFFAAESFRSEPDAIFEANVEALTRGESSGFGPMCSQTGTQGEWLMKLCSDCDAPLKLYDMDRVAFCQ